MNDIFHSGEREVQRRTGEVMIANSVGRIVKDVIVGGVINFIEKQPLAIVGSIDSFGQAWASLLLGDFGFAKVLTPKTLIFDIDKINSTKEDVFYKNIEENSDLGLLFIELVSRKRFRINGMASINKSKIEIGVQEAYPNCPKYIQRSVISLPDYFEEIRPTITQGNTLSKESKDWLIKADTIFVASLSTNKKVDVSHRGGNPGFIEIIDNDTLKIPDYRGNSMYNTLGNFVQNPNSGILLIDFAKGETLQLTGKSELLFDQNTKEDNLKTANTGRFWLFKTEKWIHTENHHKVDWELLDYSPFNP